MMLSGVAYAADPVPGMMDQWKSITTAFGETMVRQGAMLLFGLAGIQFAINGLNALRKGSDIQELVMHMVWTLVTITFFWTCIIKSPTWFPYIIDSWNAMGGAGTNTGSLDPAAIFVMGLDIVESIRSTVLAKAGISLTDMFRSLFISFQVLFVELFILLSFLVLAGQLALALLKGYLWFALGPVLLGFGGLKYTQDMALGTLKSGVSVGVTLLTTYAVAAMAQASVGIFNSQIETFELDNWMGLWNCVGVSALLAMAAWNVPKFANDFVNGSISGGLGETLATGAVAAGGAAALAGGVGGMIADAGQKAAANLGQVAQFGKNAPGGGSGDGVGAISQVAGNAITGGSLNNMLDTSPSQTRAGGGNDAFGDGADAKLSGGSGNGPISNEQLGKQLEQLTKRMGQQNEPSVGEQVRNLAGYVPNEPQSVGVNAQLGGGHE